MLRMSLSAVLPWESGCVSCEPAALWPPIYSCVGCRSTCVMAWGASLDEAANNTGIAGITCLYMYHLLILLRKCARSLIVLRKCMRKNASVCVCVCVCVCVVLCGRKAWKGPSSHRDESGWRIVR